MKNILKTKFIRNLAKVIIVFAGGVLFISLLMFLTDKLNEYLDPEPDWDKVGVSTIGTVSIIKDGRPSSTSFTFIVDDDEYIASSPFSPYGLTYTEKYEILYSKENYEKIKVINWKPVILEDEKEDFIEIEAKVTKLINAFPFGFDSDYTDIAFEFKLEDKLIRKEQSLPPNFRELYPNIEKIKSCRVKYWKYDPKRVILFLDECR